MHRNNYLQIERIATVAQTKQQDVLYKIQPAIRGQ